MTDLEENGYREGVNCFWLSFVPIPPAKLYLEDGHGRVLMLKHDWWRGFLVGCAGSCVDTKLSTELFGSFLQHLFALAEVCLFPGELESRGR